MWASETDILCEGDEDLSMVAFGGVERQEGDFNIRNTVNFLKHIFSTYGRAELRNSGGDHE